MQCKKEGITAAGTTDTTKNKNENQRTLTTKGMESAEKKRETLTTKGTEKDKSEKQ
jgi:hypothetical protein